MRHCQACIASVHEIYPGGVYRTTQTIFEKLESIGIDISLNDKHYPYYACFDFECYFSQEHLPQNGEKLIFEAYHIPMSVGIASCVPSYDQPVCYVSQGDEQELVKKLLDYLNKLFDAAYGILRQKFAYVFEALQTNLNCRSPNLAKELDEYL